MKDYYKSCYWDLLQGDVIPDQMIADELFDTGVNMGISRAVKYLQTGLNVLNRNGSLYADIVIDGMLGPKTITAMAACLLKEKAETLLNILGTVNASVVEAFSSLDDQNIPVPPNAETKYNENEYFQLIAHIIYKDEKK